MRRGAAPRAKPAVVGSLGSAVVCTPDCCDIDCTFVDPFAVIVDTSYQRGVDLLQLVMRGAADILAHAGRSGWAAPSLSLCSAGADSAAGPSLSVSHFRTDGFSRLTQPQLKAPESRPDSGATFGYAALYYAAHWQKRPRHNQHKRGLCVFIGGGGLPPAPVCPKHADQMFGQGAERAGEPFQELMQYCDSYFLRVGAGSVPEAAEWLWEQLIGPKRLIPCSAPQDVIPVLGGLLALHSGRSGADAQSSAAALAGTRDWAAGLAFAPLGRSGAESDESDSESHCGLGPVRLGLPRSLATAASHGPASAAGPSEGPGCITAGVGKAMAVAIESSLGPAPAPPPAAAACPPPPRAPPSSRRAGPPVGWPAVDWAAEDVGALPYQPPPVALSPPAAAAGQADPPADLAPPSGTAAGAQPLPAAGPAAEAAPQPPPKQPTADPEPLPPPAGPAPGGGGDSGLQDAAGPPPKRRALGSPAAAAPRQGPPGPCTPERSTRPGTAAWTEGFSVRRNLGAESPPAGAGGRRPSAGSPPKRLTPRSPPQPAPVPLLAAAAVCGGEALRIALPKSPSGRQPQFVIGDRVDCLRSTGTWNGGVVTAASSEGVRVKLDAGGFKVVSAAALRRFLRPPGGPAAALAEPPSASRSAAAPGEARKRAREGSGERKAKTQRAAQGTPGSPAAHSPGMVPPPPLLPQPEVAAQCAQAPPAARSGQLTPPSKRRGTARAADPAPAPPPQFPGAAGPPGPIRQQDAPAPAPPSPPGSQGQGKRQPKPRVKPGAKRSKGGSPPEKGDAAASGGEPQGAGPASAAAAAAVPPLPAGSSEAGAEGAKAPKPRPKGRRPKQHPAPAAAGPGALPAAAAAAAAACEGPAPAAAAPPKGRQRRKQPQEAVQEVAAAPDAPPAAAAPAEGQPQGGGGGPEGAPKPQPKRQGRQKQPRPPSGSPEAAAGQEGPARPRKRPRGAAEAVAAQPAQPDPGAAPQPGSPPMSPGRTAGKPIVVEGSPPPRFAGGPRPRSCSPPPVPNDVPRSPGEPKPSPVAAVRLSADS
eukprot:TRINITY_DN1279_c0_g1_i1.p1 TRINITY_DN1279_c0_g1~~TRINITY_DN1279_c0_g1_i1.p1  ORF type:complete len:1039 (+),score=201.88 TRINITY_DN1279_c0_g1_i1:108-3224(+)